MMLSRVLVCLAIPLVLQGCTGTLYKSEVELQRDPTIDVAKTYGDCDNLGWPAKERMKTELERRGAFTQSQWDAIQRGAIRVGDSEDLVAAAWGTPDRITQHNEVGFTGSAWYYQGNTYRPHGMIVFDSAGQVVSITQ